MLRKTRTLLVIATACLITAALTLPATATPIPPTDGAVAFRTGFEPGLDAMPSSGAADHVLLAQGTSASQQQVFAVHIPVQASTKLSYDLVNGSVSVDLQLTDGTSTIGLPAHTATTGHRVTRDIGSSLAGKTISGILVDAAGPHDASIDNLEITN